MSDKDAEYRIAYPPAYSVRRLVPVTAPGAGKRFHEAGEKFLISRLKDKRTLQAGDEEVSRVLLESFRAMANCFGDFLFFSEPEIGNSFVYSHEREYLSDTEQRWAWRVHFFQSAIVDGEYQAERYAGFLFVRPWAVHMEYATIPEFSEKHAFGHPAVCEGYVRPPVSMNLSPFYSQCMNYYAKPYGVRPFVGLPFFSSSFGSACGHNVLATAILMSGLAPIYSPYELAVLEAHLTVDAPNPSKREFNWGLEKVASTPINLYEIGAMNPKRMEDLVKTYCNGRVLVEHIAPKSTAANDYDDEAEYVEQLASYIYQGMPVLFPVDRERLYSDKDDGELLADMTATPGPTKPENQHMVLIHGMARSNRGSAEGTADAEEKLPHFAPPSPYFVFSDSTDLHRNGDLFHRTTMKRLWASRMIIEADEGRLDHGRGAVHAFYVCVPKYFEQGYSDHWIERASSFHSSSKPKLILRNRSQLRGYLLQRVFPEQYEALSTSPGLLQQEREFRERLRKVDIPLHVWILEEDEKNAEGLGDGFKGEIIDTRANSGEARFTGSYNRRPDGTARITIKGYDPAEKKQVSISYPN
ncbi:MAG: hypothetical protein HYV27_15615 [Candidatus Hydrogenedentes bacterium]|nr:hypothetical protein [Candidatus Hydrogenedentota bacterium]